ncbi:MAG: bifunctional 2-polyprenyl-6-hydroxyphenol methylase/3-demethylubiquinol 3-O-methyltransferase UbiG [Pseudomonadota bacterium]|nr:MAG: bifunctional 2-polyprenyl-6-hydroxyphenol methylase/3-demethylubiquinol 3-O-methyltransferase UbiG [Pseudomonadota bacterium]
MSESEQPPASANIDPDEAGKFDALAARWWDPEGDLRTLHDINGPRLAFLADRVKLEGARTLDVGCGGGLFSEALAARGAHVTGIDVASQSLAVARLHLAASGLSVDYRHTTAEELAAADAESFDVVCCLEMLEHVPDPERTVAACARLCRVGGRLLFSTINRSPLAWVTAIVGAEYLARLLPRGTHRYDRLIRPAELAGACRRNGLRVLEIAGLSYNPLSRTVQIGARPRVNYFLLAERPE